MRPFDRPPLRLAIPTGPYDLLGTGNVGSLKDAIHPDNPPPAPTDARFPPLQVNGLEPYLFSASLSDAEDIEDDDLEKIGISLLSPSKLACLSKLAGESFGASPTGKSIEAGHSMTSIPDGFGLFLSGLVRPSSSEVSGDRDLLNPSVPATAMGNARNPFDGALLGKVQVGHDSSHNTSGANPFMMSTSTPSPSHSNAPDPAQKTQKRRADDLAAFEPPSPHASRPTKLPPSKKPPGDDHRTQTPDCMTKADRSFTLPCPKGPSRHSTAGTPPPLKRQPLAQFSWNPTNGRMVGQRPPRLVKLEACFEQIPATRPSGLATYQRPAYTPIPGLGSTSKEPTSSDTMVEDVKQCKYLRNIAVALLDDGDRTRFGGGVVGV
ncbi:hypothetical protein FN846DRAFT_983403 [Sphaerosporella brunnea]|uniref:Uncharacterized protein n=1 Tax=Sphaerosporella brunnea TaxID=1250544 RepID=A0A5J5FC24_9PEZI|nr:hypothetical protein FN846DRAFT_983403 [Sphaerosporella brunnea]